MNSKAHYVLNINTGAVCVRTPASDEIPVILRLIDDETAAAIMSGKIKSEVVIEAINKADMSAEGFSWKEYDAKRKANEAAMNVSTREMIPVGDDEETVEKRDEKVVSLKDLGLAKDPAKKRAEKQADAPKSVNGDSPNELDGVLGK